MKQFILIFLFILSFSISFAQNNPQLVQEHRNYSETAKIGRLFDTAHYQIMHDSNYIFTIVQQMPKYPDDLNKFIVDNIKYPQKEKEKNITGTVYATFVVERDGSVSGIKILRGIPGGPGLDAEAVRVLSVMKKWSPGMQNGIRVRVQYTIPIKFQLQ
ncbi:MAG TPA: energy transducer TonB [Bacteroidia bacterium]|jgi:TonB family protein|nr:energy transducer TonB [Bacteroidia bacterium]